MEQIRRAEAGDIRAVAGLYDTVHDYFAGTVNYCAPNWQKGRYPTEETARAALRAGALFVMKAGDTLAGAMIIDQAQHPAYKNIPWRVAAAESQVLTIHTLAVDPACRGRGIGEKLIRFAIDFCRAQGAQAIRLDTHYHNVPARRLYAKCGFSSLGPWQAESCGVQQVFDVFEYALT